MKIIIEIPEEAFKHAVETQVGKSISELAEKAINEKALEILDKRVERKIKEEFPKILENAREAMLKGLSTSLSISAKRKTG
jgi:histone H3/H4